MTQILTNNINNSIILTLNSVTSSDANVVSLAEKESILYNSVAVSDILDPNYNIALLQEYVDSGVLLNETLTATHNSELQLFSQANLTLDLKTGVPEVVNITKATTDNLRALPAVDNAGNVLCIYYKSIQGMLVSYDLGATQTLISNDNLIFPDEITSFAVQVYETFNGTLRIIKRLFLGTLREGVKTFAPGDLTYTDFEPDANIGSTGQDALFKNTLTTTIITKDENNVQYINGATNINGVYYSPSPKIVNSFTTFCPTFIIGVINAPKNSGCPILIASRNMHTEATSTTVINSVTGNITTSPINIGDPTYNTKMVFKYLHASIYKDNLVTDTIVRSQFATELAYNTFISNNRWLLLQEYNSSQVNIDILTHPTFTPQVIDVITEYTPFGALFIIKQPNASGIRNILYKFTCYENLTSLPTIDTDIVLNNVLQGNLKNLSYLNEAGAGTYSIFITTNTDIYRHSSLDPGNNWGHFIYKDNPISYLSIASNNGVLSNSGTSLGNLSNFIMLPKPDASNKYIGLLGTELGLVFYDLILKNNIFIADVKNGRVLLKNMTRISTTDIKAVLNNKSIYVFICAYAKQLPNVYTNNTSCLGLVGDKLDLTKQVIYLKPDVENFNAYPYYVSEDNLYINSVPSNEQLTYLPTVNISNSHIYSFDSPRYCHKFNTLISDYILTTELQSTLAYKYYFPFITERIISDKNKMESNVLQLNEFKYYININNITNIPIVKYGTSCTIISKQTQVVLPVSIGVDSSPLYSILCVRNDGKTVLPISTIQSTVGTTQYQTTVTFSEPFTGLIFISPETGITSINITGLFSIITHNLGKYPQVQLDSRVMGILNDIRYIDINRIEISFVSAVDTTVILVGA